MPPNDGHDFTHDGLYTRHSPRGCSGFDDLFISRPWVVIGESQLLSSSSSSVSDQGILN